MSDMLPAIYVNNLNYQVRPSEYRGHTLYTRADIHEKAVKERDALKDELSRKDRAYTERMMVVRMLALKSGCVYGIAKDDNEDWDDEWRNVVYIDLPEGQVSWHIAPHDMHLFDDFPPYAGKWDGNHNGNSESFVKAIKKNALKAENERLREHIELMNWVDSIPEAPWYENAPKKTWRKKIKEIEAENERLRGALGTILEYKKADDYNLHGNHQMWEDAEEALQGGE